MPLLKTRFGLLALLMFVPTALSFGEDASNRKIDVAAGLKSLSVSPTEITLSSQRREVQPVVTGHYADGDVRDLTHAADYRVVNTAIAATLGLRVMPVKNGRTSLVVSVGTQRLSVPVVVTDQAKPDPVSFRFETLAILTKQGCNAGSCHGSPKGKGGFSLSLFAYDPRIDRESLIRGGFNRRTNVYDPDESLMLKKPLLRTTHVGGKRLRTTDVGYGILKQWIYEGAKPDPADHTDCTKIEVIPGPHRVLHAPYRGQQLRVVALFSDGTTRDVTRIATYESSDKEVATVNADGLVTGHARGQSAISVRYLAHLQSVNFTVVEDIKDFRWTNSPENNDVDRHVHAKLKQLQYLPSETCSDAVFIRRVFLDLTGLLPTAEQTQKFLQNDAKHKRSRLIDDLLRTPEFARFWASKNADLLRVNDQTLKDGRARLFADWLYKSWRTNQPFDDVARQLITASGSTLDNPPANYFLGLTDTLDVAETTSQIFMGSRIQCAKCHNHPFENWTQSDYYRIAAVFHRVQKREGTIAVAAVGEMMHPTTGEVMQPWGLKPLKSGPATQDARRIAFADWLTRKGNPFFARVEVNRIWAHLLGRGIVDPIDDFRSSNPPSNSELLNALADDFERSGYDRRHIIRIICNSRTYQRSTATNRFNASDEKLFSHARVRMLTAEQLQDAVGYVTGSLESTAGVQKQIAELSAREKQLQQTSQKRRPQWEIETRKQLEAEPVWGGGWWSVGPFPGKNTQSTDFVPTAKPIDITRPVTDGKQWRRQRDWIDGRKIDLGKQRNAAVYVLRTIHCMQPMTVTARLQADDGCHIWLNQKLIHEQKRTGQKDLPLELAKGQHQLLIKITNLQGTSSFQFQLRDSKGKPVATAVPGFVAEILLKPTAQRSETEQRILRDHYRSADTTLADVSRRLRSLTGWTAYATQRPVPQQTEFLKAFGQPKRETACTCERSNEPTLARALQLLNGAEIRTRVLQSTAKYAKLKNEQLIEQLYLAAFSRSPTAKERATALRYLKQGETREAAIHDLVWAIVNTQEFLFQH